MNIKKFFNRSFFFNQWFFSINLGDRTFQTKKFYRDLQDLITPAGVSFYQSDWDDSLTTFFHNTLGNC